MFGEAVACAPPKIPDRRLTLKSTPRPSPQNRNKLPPHRLNASPYQSRKPLTPSPSSFILDQNDPKTSNYDSICPPGVISPIPLEQSQKRDAFPA